MVIRNVAFCDVHKETTIHLIKDCNFIKAITFASKWGLLWDKFQWDSLEGFW